MFTFGIPVTQKRKIIEHFEASSNLVKIHNNYNDDNDNNITDGNNNIDAASSNDDDKNNHDHENYNLYHNGDKWWWQRQQCNNEINILDWTKTRISTSIYKISDSKDCFNNSWMITDARRKGMHSRTKQKLITMVLDHE